MLIFQVTLEVEPGSEHSKAEHALEPQAQMLGFDVTSDIVFGSASVATSIALRLWGTHAIASSQERIHTVT